MSTFHAVYDDERCLEPVAIIAEEHLKDAQHIVYVLNISMFAVAITNIDYQLN